MRDIAVVMLTMDRSPRPNYLGETLANLRRGGLFASPRLHSFHVVDSGGAPGWPDGVLAAAGVVDATVHRSPERRNAKWNKVAAWEAGARCGAPWMLLLEDDLDVCRDFLGSVGRWLDQFSDPRDEMAVHPFGAANAAQGKAYRHGRAYWRYPSEHFWGLQCVAFRQAAAASVAAHVHLNPFYRHSTGMVDPLATDLEVGRWHGMIGRPFFLAAAPAFVQHIGVQSAVEPGRTWTVKFPSWPGRGWTYGGQQQQQGVAI